VGAPTHFQSPVLAAVPPILSPPLAGFSTSSSPGSPDGGGPRAVGAPTRFHCPTLAAVPPPLAPPLADSSTGPGHGASDGGTPEAVVAPTLFQSLALAAAHPILSPPLAGSSTSPSPGSPDGGPLGLWEPLPISTVPPWLQFLLPWPHHLLVPLLGPAPWPLKGEPPESVGAPIHFQSPSSKFNASMGRAGAARRPSGEKGAAGP